MELFRIDNCCT